VVRLGELADRDRLALALGVELDLPRVAAVLVDLGARRDRTVDAEHRGERLDDLLRRARDEPDAVSLGPVRSDQRLGLGVDEGLDHLGQRLFDDGTHFVSVPACRDLEHRLADLRHLLLVGAEPQEEQLPEHRSCDGAAIDESASAERASERNDRRACDDRFVKIEERSPHKRNSLRLNGGGIAGKV
jgi:hypothetical protein